MLRQGSLELRQLCNNLLLPNEILFGFVDTISQNFIFVFFSRLRVAIIINFMQNIHEFCRKSFNVNSIVRTWNSRRLIQLSSALIEDILFLS